MQRLSRAIIKNMIAVVCVTGMTGTSFAQLNNSDNLSTDTTTLNKKVELKDQVDSIVVGNSLTIENMFDWQNRQKRMKRFLECGLCGEGQSFPE